MVARSAGVSDKSPHQVSDRDLDWADLVLVMERKYRSRILGAFRDYPNLPQIVSLEIPDDYEYMDQELIELIERGTKFHLKSLFALQSGAAPTGGPA